MTNIERPTADNIHKQVRNAKGQLISATPTKAILDALNTALLSIRQRFPDVPNVVLVVGHSDAKRHGHFAPTRWDGKTVHEIALSGESLSRGAVPTLGTLIHECAHAAAQATGVQDTSRQGRYHNVRFRDIATSMGIQVEKVQTIGWSSTTVPESTQKTYKAELALLRKALKTYRIPEISGKIAKKKTSISLECSCEEQGVDKRKITIPIRIFEQGEILCSICDEAFEPVD